MDARKLYNTTGGANHVLQGRQRAAKGAPGRVDYLCAELNNRTNSLKSSSLTSDTAQMDMPS